MKRIGTKAIPEFKTLEEEREYWEARGPLAEGRKGRVNKPQPGQRRSSFLAVRLTGEELTRLRDIASKQGLGPSTFARLVLAAAIEQGSKLPRGVTLDQLTDMLQGNLPQPIRAEAEALAKSIVIGDPQNPILLIDPSQMRKAEEFALSFLSTVLAMAGVQVITPENESYQKAREILKSAT